MNRIATVLFTALALTACAPQPSEPTEETGRPVVALLVIDDFSPLALDDERIVSAVRSEPPSNCAVSWNGQYYGSQGMVKLPDGSEVPHGKLVYEFLSELLAKSGATPSGRGSGASLNRWLGNVEHWQFDPAGTVGDVILAEVDTDGYTTESIRDNIEEAITFFGSAQSIPTDTDDDLNLPLAEGFVLNMSFAVVPCNLATIGESEYEGMIGVDPGLEDLAKQLATLSGEQINLSQAMWFLNPDPALAYPDEDDPQQWLADDPLGGWLEEWDSGGNIIAVAAAGNTAGTSFPYAPARWPGVIAASACQTEDCVNGVSDFNSGEVLESGLNLDPTTRLIGSSFAAPRVSLREAIYFLRNGSTTCDGAAPPLDYADDTTRNWDNLLMCPDAAATYCGSFCN